MNIAEEAIYRKAEYNSRRHFLKNCTSGLGAIALGSMLGCNRSLFSDPATKTAGFIPGLPHFAPKAKRVIFMHMAGGPAHLELFDYKPELQRLDGKDTPQALMEGKNFAFIKGTPQLLGPRAGVAQAGGSGTYPSAYLPESGGAIDQVTLLKATHTDEFNHAPAQLLMPSGRPRLGTPRLASWTVNGLGSENENVP